MSRTITGPRRIIAAGLASVVLVGGVALAGSAAAEPRRSIAEVEAQLTALESKAEAAAEDYNGAQVKLDQVQRKLTATKKRVDAAKAKVAEAQQVLGQIAAGAYRSGGVDTSLQLLLADDPQDFLRQAAALDQVTISQSASLRRTQTARLQLAQATAALQEQEAAAEAVAKQMAEHKAAVDSAVEEQRQLLAQLREEERQRLAELERQRQAAAAAAAAAARDQAARADRDESGYSGSQDAGGGGAYDGASQGAGSSGASDGAGYSSDRAATAVSVALAQLGEPYSYSASPPSSWDCSKLVAYAWGAAGVSLTAYSYAMADQVRRISTSELQPGDILFYFNGAHHVAMYIGGGQLVEASSPRTGVRVTSLWNSWSSAHFSFAGRPIG